MVVLLQVIHQNIQKMGSSHKEYIHPNKGTHLHRDTHPHKGTHPKGYIHPKGTHLKEDIHLQGTQDIHPKGTHPKGHIHLRGTHNKDTLLKVTHNMLLNMLHHLLLSIIIINLAMTLVLCKDVWLHCVAVASWMHAFKEGKVLLGS